MPLRTEKDRTCSRLLGDATIIYTIDIKDQFSNFKSRKAKRILDFPVCQLRNFIEIEVLYLRFHRNFSWVKSLSHDKPT